MQNSRSKLTFKCEHSGSLAICISIEQRGSVCFTWHRNRTSSETATKAVR